MLDNPTPAVFLSAPIRSLPLPCLWAAIWLTALTVPWLPSWVLIPTLVFLLALVVQLAPGRPQGRRLILAAAGFWLFWSLLMLLAHLLRPTAGGLRPMLNLAAWLALGLILVLSKPPLALALAAAGFLSPVLGRPRAQKLALALALLTRLIPNLLTSALIFRAVLSRRAAGLPLTRRMALWGRSLIRDTLSQAEDLARALSLRWPW